MNNSELYLHFHPDERHFIDQALDWISGATQYHDMKQTDFLDPRQAHILTTLIHREPDVHLRLDGGFPEAERKRAIIAPSYRALDYEQVAISVLSVTAGDSKLSSLDHGDYMGAILNLGVKRDKIGDIIVVEHGCQYVVATEMIDYLRLHLQQVHRVHVQTEVVSMDQLQVPPVQLQILDLTVASLRLDAIVSDVHRLSRSKVLIPIRAGKCRVNWKQEEDPSKHLNEGDIVSLQGLGRFKVMEASGMTRKGRIRLKVGKYI